MFVPGMTVSFRNLSVILAHSKSSWGKHSGNFPSDIALPNGLSLKRFRPLESTKVCLI